MKHLKKFDQINELVFSGSKKMVDILRELSQCIEIKNISNNCNITLIEDSNNKTIHCRTIGGDIRMTANITANKFVLKKENHIFDIKQDVFNDYWNDCIENGFKIEKLNSRIKE